MWTTIWNWFSCADDCVKTLFLGMKINLRKKNVFTYARMYVPLQITMLLHDICSRKMPEKFFSICRIFLKFCSFNKIYEDNRILPYVTIVLWHFAQSTNIFVKSSFRIVGSTPRIKILLWLINSSFLHNL